MPECLHDVENVFGSVVFDGSFLMSKSVDCDSQQTGILKLEGETLSLLTK